MDPNDNRDAFGKRRRSNGEHDIGDSMPGDVGDAQRILHERLGEVPTAEENIKVPSEAHFRETEETTVDHGADVEELVARLND